MQQRSARSGHEEPDDGRLPSVALNRHRRRFERRICDVSRFVVAWLPFEPKVARCLQRAVSVSSETSLQRSGGLLRCVCRKREPLFLRLGKATGRSESGPHRLVLLIPSSSQGWGEPDTEA